MKNNVWLDQTKTLTMEDDHFEFKDNSLLFRHLKKLREINHVLNSIFEYFPAYFTLNSLIIYHFGLNLYEEYL